MEKIQMVDLGRQYQDIKTDVDHALQKVLNSSSFINGQEVRDFSVQLSKWNQSAHVITCANGTDGLQIALMALDLNPGDEVIVPSFTYIATVEVIALLGLVPVFVDVDPNTFNIDVNQIESKVSDRTKVIVPVHLYGQCADMDAINAIANQNKLFVIEDLAQAIGSKYKDKKAGNLGHIGVTSFFPSKNLGCFGDGGAIFTNDDELAGKIKMIANHGQSKKYYHDIVGVNSRLDTLQAAILNVKLKKLDSYIEARQRAASCYDHHLVDVSSVVVPQRMKDSTHVFHQYTLKIPGRRDEIKSYLQNNGIPSMIYYPLVIPDQQAYKHYTGELFPISKSLSETVLSLPMHTHLKEETIAYICGKVKEFFHG
ncbi:DegT/DnrJ/EryC1/StrS family aminotransferase [Ekhidna sp.]|uniref:DegT/DnrJ/EryC1/StrS family aminotransferase n=1 Tax=Ekhidna sp. TaxID=2608089 RepID=UPI003C79BD6C